MGKLSWSLWSDYAINQCFPFLYGVDNWWDGLTRNSFCHFNRSFSISSASHICDLGCDSQTSYSSPRWRTCAPSKPGWWHSPHRAASSWSHPWPALSESGFSYNRLGCGAARSCFFVVFLALKMRCRHLASRLFCQCQLGTQVAH